LEVIRHFNSGSDCAMAGAAIGAVAMPRAADLRNRRRFIGDVSLYWPVAPADIAGYPFPPSDRVGSSPRPADYRASAFVGNFDAARVRRERLRLGFSAAPFLGQTESDGQQHRSDEDADEAECQHAAEHTEEHQQKRQLAPAANEIGLQEIVENEDDGESIEQQSGAPPNLSLSDEPDAWRQESEHRPERHQAEEKSKQREEQGAGDAGLKEAELGQSGLHQRSSENPIDDATGGRAGEIDQVLGPRPDETLRRHREMLPEEPPIAIHEERDDQAKSHLDAALPQARGGLEYPVRRFGYVGPEVVCEPGGISLSAHPVFVERRA